MADTTLTPDRPAWTGAGNVDELEQRLQKLEDVVAAICDTQSLEERVLQRVTEKLSTDQPIPAESTSRLLSRDELPPHPSEREIALFKPPTAVFAPPTTHYMPPQGSMWITELTIFGEIWWEVRAFFRMVRDPLYRISWICRVVPLLCLFYVMVWSWISAYFFGSIPVINLIDDLIVVYIGFKVVGRELRRYREHEARYGRQ